MTERFENIHGLAALEKALDELPLKIERNIVRGALRAGTQGFVRELARSILPITRTGKLARSVRVSIRKSFGRVYARVTAGGRGAFYAPLVEFGTAAHTIRPTEAKALGLPSGHPVDVVRHPGAAAKPFMRPAFDRGWRAATDLYAAYIRRRLTKAGIEIPSE